MSKYDMLNDKQKEAVFHTEGPVLILAGAGSGKTRVLTHRIAYLIEEKHVNPWNILAITFTNKAAGEMRERVDRLVECGAPDVWVSTFHSACARILRRHIDRLGYESNFTIYDPDDQKTLMKAICRQLRVDTKMFREKQLLAHISGAKNEMILPDEYELMAEGDYRRLVTAKVYREYEKQMKQNNALDFDDLLVKTVQLFTREADILESYQERFRYIMVDEYQDTNKAQFQLVSILAKKYRNLCVVGDDDQSIYKFRGADIRNILDFEDEFNDAYVVRLEQNYRSTKNILSAANSVIKNNTGRKEKTLWTDNAEGAKPVFKEFYDAHEEAQYVVNDIKKHVESGTRTYHDHAILYRTNMQSRMFEEYLVAANIPYKIIGGINFYARREIKDLLAYLKTIDNGVDDIAVKRILNVPKRGIGLTTINRVQENAMERGVSFYEALRTADMIPDLKRSAARLESFVALIEHFKGRAKEIPISRLMEEILDATGYEEELKKEDDEEAKERIANIEELKSKIVDYEESCGEDTPTLGTFLEEVALVADIDALDENADYVVLMTLHGAKGLEFPEVYLAGMEDGLFPGYMSISSEDENEIEEERRLCYVGITRARENLTLTCAGERMVNGEVRYNRVSRFIKEIPAQFLSDGRNANGRNAKSGVSVKNAKEPGQEKKAYAKAKEVFYAQVFNTGANARTPVIRPGEGLSYGPGDRVRHVKFGEGVVTHIVKGGRDYEVTVDFDNAGTKKMFAGFAKLEKI